MKRAIAVVLFAMSCSRGETSFPVEPPRPSTNLRALAGHDAIDCGLALDRASAVRVYDCASRALSKRAPFFCRYPPSGALDRFAATPHDQQSMFGIAFVGTRNGTVYGVIRSRSGALLRRAAIVGNRAPSTLRRIGIGMVPPMASSDVSARLPKLAEKIAGIVIVECVIGTEGTVRDARVLKALPLGIDKAALQLVMTTRFEPARFFGVAMPVLYNVTVNVSDGIASVRREPNAGPVMPQGDIPGAIRGVT